MHDWKQECKHIQTRGTCSQYDAYSGCCKSMLPGGCQPIVDECLTAGVEFYTDPNNKEKQLSRRIPCNKIRYGLCSVFLIPANKWSGNGPTCAFAAREVQIEVSQKINPLKASKRAAAGKKA